VHSAILTMQAQQNKLPAGSPESAQLGGRIKQYSASYAGLRKLQSSIDTLTAQEKRLNKGIAAFNTQISKAKAALANGKAALAENEKKLDGGYGKYKKNLAAFTSKMSDAEAKIQTAKGKLSEIGKPVWTVMKRSAAVAGYSAVKSGIDAITSVARIFPLFFILIVLLMTSNTMARMIAEERGELGTLASLGFKNGSIISTYLFYVLSATALGTTTGFFAGCTIIPKIIYLCFPYILPPLTIQFNAVTFLLILAFSVALMTLVTVFFCNRELKQEPAALMRPVPPANGQNILLERIGLIWKRLSFTWKVTMRNIFRYKQKVFMTIAGIAGCTALLLAGFGLKDSMSGVAQKQYGQIFTYSDLMALKNETHGISGSLQNLLTKERIENPALIRQTTLTCDTGGKLTDAYLIVPENIQTFYRYFKLKSTGTEKRIMLNDSGVVISEQLSEIYKIGKGDKIKVQDADNHSYTFTVSGVTENSMQNYLYMSKNLYRTVFKEPAAYNLIVSDHAGNEKALAERLIGSKLIVNVNFKDDIIKQAVEGNKSINNVVILLVCIASLLAVVVLYNLTSINISERKREIATLKVLGFTDGETSAYIYREAVILTLISIGVGLVLGIGLHRFVMGVIQGDDIIYFKTIKGLSYLWTILITAAFSVLMQIFTFFKLKKIDMIESLKSVE
jgi:ABC-type antimicrobial peptide transport system, permease component